jgi:hypothetical protein
MNRAITSAPPPEPAGITTSIGFCGSHAVAIPNNIGNIPKTLSIDTENIRFFTCVSLDDILLEEISSNTYHIIRSFNKE